MEFGGLELTLKKYFILSGMFEDFEFEDKYNPWDVKSLEEFRYYCCPECPSKYVNKTDFIKHVVTVHPQSQSTIETLEDNKAVIKTELREVESTNDENTKPDKSAAETVCQTSTDNKAVEPLKEKETFANIVKRFFPTAPDFQPSQFLF